MLDLLLTNARVITLDDEWPVATSVGILHGRIVGVDEQIAGLKARHTVNLAGATVVPGFHDAHNHMATFGRKLLEIDAGTFSSLDGLYSAIRKQAERFPDRRWIIASGYDQSTLGGHPERLALDAAAPGHNVIVNHRTTHMLVASTAVFEQLGAMRADFKPASGGFIERMADGTPTGLVGEQAMIPFRGLLKPFSLTDLADAIGRASEVYLTEGITSVCEAGIGNSAVVGSSPIELAAYQNARESGQLKVRTQLMVAMENLHHVDTNPVDGFDLGLDLGIRTGLGDAWLSIGALKMFTDGALMSRTASLTNDFCDHGGRGMLQFDAEYLRERATAAHRAGWQLAVHAIGDNAVDLALDVIEEANGKYPRAGHRHRIEHASVVRPDQLERMVRLQVVPSPQGRFVYEIGDGVAAGLGEARLPWTYRHASFISAGLTVPGSSDRPVVDGAPLLGMQAMVQRRTKSGRTFTPDEAVTATEALRSFTVDSAYAAKQEKAKGRIRSGFLADLAVLDADPTSIDADAIGSIRVLATVVDGVAAHDTTGQFDLR